jgi:hypothetical protein
MEGLKIVSLEDDTVETITVSHEETFETVVVRKLCFCVHKCTIYLTSVPTMSNWPLLVIVYSNILGCCQGFKDEHVILMGY